MSAGGLLFIMENIIQTALTDMNFMAMAWNSNVNEPLTYINLKFNRDDIGG